MDKQAVLNQFEAFHEKYTMITGNPLYSKNDLLNFYLQGRIDANADLIKTLNP